jgi:hypothetical protein
MLASCGEKIYVAVKRGGYFTASDPMLPYNTSIRTQIRFQQIERNEFFTCRLCYKLGFSSLWQCSRWRTEAESKKKNFCEGPYAVVDFITSPYRDRAMRRIFWGFCKNRLA